jgi:hypothetical protein
LPGVLSGQTGDAFFSTRAFSFLTSEKNEAAFAGGFEIILTPYGIEPNATR